MDSALLHASGHSPEDKIEERITFALKHAQLYLSESYDEWDEKSSAANTINIYCGGGESSSLLSAITVSLLATSEVVCCWIFLSALFIPNYPLPIDDMVN